ncbi:HTH-type transcriptional regulator HdfR [Streptomyces fumanus]
MPAPSHLDPRLLRAFVTVAEELHFTRAASRLYVAQQALSRDVRRLERALGAELFLRTTRQVTLTADGEKLLPSTRRSTRCGRPPPCSPRRKGGSAEPLGGGFRTVTKV